MVAEPQQSAPGDTPINVTRPFLPPLDEFVDLLRGIWDRAYLTNHGPLVRRLEEELAAYLGVGEVILTANGTLALQLAARALDLAGAEVVTTPLSYVASVSSLVWEGCRPVFVDVDPETLCIDPGAIPAAVTPRTRAILGVHVYGTPCDDDAIRAVAGEHGLAVLYDGAHAFGARLGGDPVLGLGDVSTTSFHATKVFHTVEGGALITEDPEVAFRLRYLRHNGHESTYAFHGLGINAKNTEVHAAMGLAVLPYVDRLIARRRELSERYDEALAGAPLQRPRRPPGLEPNHTHYPVLLPSPAAVDRAVGRLAAIGVNPRRYFYPPLTELPYVEGADCPVAEDAAARVLCLPLFPDLREDQVARIATAVREAL